MEDDFCITSCFEDMPDFEKFFPELDIVVNFSVENDLETLILV
jgi:hypothetical protein